ncbi:hypothetical protein DFA_05647 [Cavenderia fasciculata]|uniref:Restriction endonuclease domain-containing protein n=1 Tax=Cavenderia fasciculata TaxID=261658 RepID=F4PLW0_CACFS|nr:uncharacterized protein DFA_05647 [Cavenderia fasciculata]EGG23514.1 hypothetical protein DFA_05647 [Cavenderia fasciculata]|eukprot:XP_004361365.1 hypothetical protein DFA_05647 [Cavenderia fasciculata]
MREWESKITLLKEIHLNSNRRDDDESDRVEIEPPYIIAKGVTMKKFLERRERDLLGHLKNTKLAFVNGDVLVYELENSEARAILTGWFSGWITKSHVDPFIQITGSTDIIISPNIVRQPDNSFRPRGGKEGPFPRSSTMVVEVGYLQSLQSLQDKAIQYLGVATEIQIVLSLLYDRSHSVNHPQTVISFGTSPLNYTNQNIINSWYNPPTTTPTPSPSPSQSTNDNTCILEIPTSSLFHGVVHQLEGIPVTIPLNLLQLRSELNDIQF